MTFEEKEHFVKSESLKLLQNLRAKAQPWFGVMTPQHMIEHLTWTLQNASEKVILPLSTPLDKLEKAKEFLMSDKEFKEGTKHPNLKESPEPLRNSNIIAAYEEFERELNAFFDFFESNPGRQTIHPAFGSLNYEEWIQCAYKHLVHHFKQFDLMR